MTAVLLDWVSSNGFHASWMLAVAWCVDRLFAERAPHVALAAWCAALLRLVLPPDLWSPFGVGSWFESTSGAAAACVSSEAAPGGIPAWLVVWIVGALALFLHTHRVARRSGSAIERRRRPGPGWLPRAVRITAARAGLARVPEVLVSSAVRVACVVPGRRPRVVLPTALLDDRRATRHVLLHEFTHVRRRDARFRGLVSALRTVWWFHPLVWIAAARVAALQEILCDGDVARLLGHRSRAYRRTLLRLAAGSAGVRPPVGPGFLAAGSLTLQRARFLAGERWSHSRGRRAAGLLAVGLAAACVLPVAPRPDRSVAVPVTAASDVDAQQLEAARDRLARHAAGERDPGCLQLRYAAMLVAAQESAASNTNSTPKGIDRP